MVNRQQTLCCSCISKDSKNSANHNMAQGVGIYGGVVLASAKIVKIQLITTISGKVSLRDRCSCISKDSKNSANHNSTADEDAEIKVVLASAKIVKIQLITTVVALAGFAEDSERLLRSPLSVTVPSPL